MVTLNKIYTRTGDDGYTALGSTERVAKNHARVEAYGTVDELNAQLGFVIACIKDSALDKYSSALQPLCDIVIQIQNDLFDLGADLCVPVTKDDGTSDHLRVQQHYVDRMEKYIDDINSYLTPLKSFILPGGTKVSSTLHIARTICRRAERRLITLMQQDHMVTFSSLHYVNRLSDLLFVLSRRANQLCECDDILWIPAKNAE